MSALNLTKLVIAMYNEKTVSEVLTEYSFYTIFDILDWIDKRISESETDDDQDRLSSYKLVKEEIESEMCRTIRESR